MQKSRFKPLQFLLNNSTIVLFIAVFIIFGLTSPRTVIEGIGLEFPRFWLPENMLNIIKQAAVFAGIIGVGMTFVLLTAGIDLSVGSNMYFSVVCAGLLMRSLGLEIIPALLVSLIVGTLFGAFNAFCIVRLKIIPFMTTLATLVIGRGLGTALTESRQIDFPERMNAFGQTLVLGVIGFGELLQLGGRDVHALALGVAGVLDPRGGARALPHSPRHCLLPR